MMVDDPREFIPVLSDLVSAPKWYPDISPEYGEVDCYRLTHNGVPVAYLLTRDNQFTVHRYPFSSDWDHVLFEYLDHAEKGTPIPDATNDFLSRYEHDPKFVMRMEDFDFKKMFPTDSGKP